MRAELQFLGILNTLLKRSDIAYKGYMNSGKIFLYAKILKECNDSIRDVLIHNAHLLPFSQVENAIALLHHIDVWGAIWEDVVERERPALLSVFTFDNTVNFPRSEVSELMAYYEGIRL